MSQIGSSKETSSPFWFNLDSNVGPETSPSKQSLWNGQIPEKCESSG